VIILDASIHSFLGNKSFLCGEQVFTSLLFHKGRPLFLSEHIQRLIKGASYLFPDCNWPHFENDIHAHVLNELKGETRDCYCRLTIVNDNFFVVKKSHEVSNQNISLTTAFQVKTANLKPSFLKLSQYAETFLELKHANISQVTDIIFFDSNNLLTEASTSNVFIVKNDGELMTPNLSSMVLDGILRQQLMLEFKIIQKNITKKEVMDASEIWLSNSIKGLRFVTQYETRKFQRTGSQFDKMENVFGRYGEKICEQKS
jgi:4-amino-4-deoxychorismate lyase